MSMSEQINVYNIVLYIPLISISTKEVKCNHDNVLTESVQLLVVYRICLLLLLHFLATCDLGDVLVSGFHQGFGVRKGKS